MSRRRSPEEDEARADQFRCPGCETPTRGARFCGACRDELGLDEPEYLKQEEEWR